MNTLLRIVERHWPRIIDNRDRISPESCATFIIVSLLRDERFPQEERKKKEKVEEQERKRGREKNNIFTRVQTLFRTFLRNLASYIILKKNRKQGGGWMREEGG